MKIVYVSMGKTSQVIVREQYERRLYKISMNFKIQKCITYHAGYHYHQNIHACQKRYD